MNDQVKIATHLQGLFEQVSAKESGTFFVSTKDNQSCQIVIQQGSLVGLSLGSIKGDAVVDLLLDYQFNSGSFKKNLMMPLDPAASVSDSEVLLKKLGYTQPEIIEEPVEIEATEPVVEKPVRTYRGQVIQESADSKEAQKSIPIKPSETMGTSMPPKKLVRTYRGQVIQE